MAAGVFAFFALAKRRRASARNLAREKKIAEGAFDQLEISLPKPSGGGGGASMNGMSSPLDAIEESAREGPSPTKEEQEQMEAGGHMGGLLSKSSRNHVRSSSGRGPPISLSLNRSIKLEPLSGFSPSYQSPPLTTSRSFGIRASPVGQKWNKIAPDTIDGNVNSSVGVQGSEGGRALAASPSFSDKRNLGPRTNSSRYSNSEGGSKLAAAVMGRSPSSSRYSAGGAPIGKGLSKEASWRISKRGADEEEDEEEYHGLRGLKKESILLPGPPREAYEPQEDVRDIPNLVLEPPSTTSTARDRPAELEN